MNPTEDWLTRADGLAERLRALRTRAGLSGKALAEATGWPASKVSRLEHGRQMPTPADLHEWVRACAADAEAADALVELHQEAQTVHNSWRRRMRGGQVAVQSGYNRLVRDSTLHRNFATAVIPGLLQTPDYARHILAEVADFQGLDPHDAAEAAATRMQRQQALYDPAKRFEFLLAEPALRWLVATAEVMRGQLDRLQTVIRAPNIRFGILPLGVPLTVTPENSFCLFDDIAIVESFIGETIYRGDEAAAYARVMDRLWADAVEGDAARHLIIRAAEQLP